MAQTIATGAEKRIRMELLEGKSIQSVASSLGLSYNSVAKRYRKLVEQGEIKDKVKHPFVQRLPLELQEFIKMERNSYFEYELAEKEDCEFTVAFLNEKCTNSRSDGKFCRFIHRWVVKTVGDKIRIVKIR